MSRRPFAPIAALVLALALAPPAAAFDPAAMTPGEKAAFGAAVKDWLLANPEVLIDMAQALEERQYADQLKGEKRLLAENHDAIFEDGYSWVGGNPEGDVTVVEFMDYRCGFCRRAKPEVEELIRSDGNIRYIVKEFPVLGEASTISSKFAIALRQLAGDEAYATVHDALMTLRGEPTDATLARLATEAGADAMAVLARMEAPEVEQEIARNHELGRTLGIQGTPTYVIDGTMVRGYVPLDGMRQIVAGERG